MSEVTVLDIPLQNSLTPRVGTYSGEGRSDTTFEYDSESGEYSLVSNSITKGYYYYYPIQPVPADNIIIEFDIKINDSSYCFLLFNCGTESTTDNWWGYWGYSTGGMRLNLHSTVKDIYLNNLNQEWHHITVYVQKVESENKTYFCTKDNGVICDYSSMANFDCTIYNLALLGNTSTDWGANANLKNIKVLGDISGFAHINLHLGNEVLRAYAMPPIPDKSTLAIVSFKGIVDGNIVKNYVSAGEPYDEYTIPDAIDNTKSAYFRFGISSYTTNDNPSNHYSFYYDNDFNDYVYEKTGYYENSGHTTRFDLIPVNADYLGFSNTQRRLAIEFKKAITNWKPGQYITPNYKFEIALIAAIDPIINTGNTNNTICQIMCDNTGHFTCRTYGSYNNGTAVSAQDDLTIELDAVHTYSVYIERNYPVKTLLVKCYIDGQLRYTETITNVGVNDCSFYLQDTTYTNTLYKMGTIKVFNDEPGSSFKKLNVKRNNSLYYLLASNTGLYPSRLRAKIDGTTYSILTKHDLDT